MKKMTAFSFFLNSYLLILNFFVPLQPQTENGRSIREGEMLEWLKRHAWKACNRPKRFRGSNPRLSARNDGVQSVKGESPSLRKE